MNQVIEAQELIIKRQDDLIKTLKALDENNRGQIATMRNIIENLKKQLEILNRSLQQEK